MFRLLATTVFLFSIVPAPSTHFCAAAKVELHLEGESLEIPKPSDIGELEKSGEFLDGVWMLIDIDLSKLQSKPMRLNVSLPAYVVKQMDDFATQNHLSRSALIVKATQAYLEVHKS